MPNQFVVPYIREEALAAMRRNLRDRLQDAAIPVPMGHASEAVAAALGDATHAALLARTIGKHVYDAPFEPGTLLARLATLTGRSVGELVGPVARFLAWARLTGALEGPEQPRAPGAEALPPIDFRTRDRMIAVSKSGYLARHPGNQVVFNAQLCTPSAGRVWWGDLDVTRDAPALQILADELGEPLHVVTERAAAGNPARPDTSRPAATFSPRRTA